MLTCECDLGFADWWYYPPEDFVPYRNNKHTSCCSCGNTIRLGNFCLEFERGMPTDEFANDEIMIDSWFMCETCGEIYFNLTAIGYCIYLGGDDGNMKKLLQSYWELTGFQPKGLGKTVFGIFRPPLEAVYEIMRFVIFGWRR